MFKLPLVMAFGLVFSLSNAFAMPNVGDQAIFDMSAVKDGQTVQFLGMMELMQFDAAQNKYLERDTQKVPGMSDQVTDSWKDASDLPTEAGIAQLLAQCAAAGGEPKSISVPAGTFDTCGLPVDANNRNKGTVYLGKVPFGVVRADVVSDDGTPATMALKSFH